MSRQHVMGNIILISITVSEIWDHCQNLLDDPRILLLNTPFKRILWISPYETIHSLLFQTECVVSFI